MCHLLALIFSFKYFYLTLLDRTASGASILGQSGPGSDGNKLVPCIPQSSSINGASLLDCLESRPGHSLGWGITPLQRCSRCIQQPQLTGPMIEKDRIYFNTSLVFHFKIKKKKEEIIRF